jgi:hypothetical protein
LALYRAWRHFVEAVEADAPSERCKRVRRLLGEVEAGEAPGEATAEIDAHALDCASCKVFARESYRALEVMPYAPVVGLTEQWANRIAAWWERAGPEASAGARTAATGAGLSSLLGGGSVVGLFKAVAIVCSATAVTAGVCAGVVAVLENPPERRHQRRERAEHRRERTPAPTPAATFVATPTPTPAPTRTPAPKPQRSKQRDPDPPAFDPSGESEIPAAAPAATSEFNPASGSSRVTDPAPIPDTGGGEFSP